MLQIEQYNSFFNIYIYLLLVIPAVILGFLGKKSKLLNIGISMIMLILLLVPGSLQLWEFLGFLGYEICIIFVYFWISKKYTNKVVYFLMMGLSILPIALVKIAGRTAYGNIIGFVGISYIGFKAWELLFQIRDGKIKILSFIDVLGFLTFGPVFSSGPIARFDGFCKEYEIKISQKTYWSDYLIPGIKKLILGMFYKFSVAFLVNQYFLSTLEIKNVKNTILYMYGYTFYLFFDFAGYSLMAVGMGYFMGIRLPDNFNKPFLARNMKEFWERWHISLSTWFNDYIFSRFVLSNVRNGLFKNPKKAAKWAYMVTMLVMGFWHGLYLHYILYGLYEGVMLVLTDYWLKSKTFRRVKKMKYYDLVSRLICFQIMTFGMLLFSGYLMEI